MKAGQTLAEIAIEIERQAEAKRDFITPSRALVVTEDAKRVRVGDKGEFELSPIAHKQIGEHLGIHASYYAKMQSDAPDLLATNVNRWLAKNGNEPRMVRTLDDRARAFVSSKFRTLDNFDLAKAILPQMRAGSFLFLSGALTESRFHLKMVREDIKGKIPTGKSLGDGTHTIFDAVGAALYFGNSEVGHGSFFLELGSFTRLCTNLAWFGANMRKFHIGARADISAEVYELLRDETRAASDAAIYMQAADMMRAALTQYGFDKLCATVAESANDKLDGDVPAIVEVVGKKMSLNEGERQGVLTHLIQGGDLSRYGLHSAITRASADIGDYDRASDLEKIGGSLVTMPHHEWTRLLKQAA